MKLKGKVAVVTGGNSGIGLAAAQEFKAQGAEVVIFGRTQKALDDAVQTIGNGTLAVSIGSISRRSSVSARSIF